MGSNLRELARKAEFAQGQHARGGRGKEECIRSWKVCSRSGSRVRARIHQEKRPPVICCPTEAPPSTLIWFPCAESTEKERGQPCLAYGFACYGVLLLYGQTPHGPEAKVRKVHPTDMASSQCLEIRMHQKRLYIDLQELWMSPRLETRRVGELSLWCTKNWKALCVEHKLSQGDGMWGTESPSRPSPCPLPSWPWDQ